MDPEDIEACRPLFCLRHLLPLRLATVHGLHLSPRLGQLLLGTLGCGLRLGGGGLGWDHDKVL